MPDRLLAIDGGLGGFSVAVLLPEATYARDLPAKAALESGLDAVDAVLAEAGLRLGELDALAVGIGPGSFTGLRIAIAFAKSLAFGAGLGLVPVSSYDALLPDDAPERALAVVAGRPGVICGQRRDGADVRERCGPLGEVLADLTRPGEEIAVAGATEGVLRALAERHVPVLTLGPRAALPALAIAQIARARSVAASLHAVAPAYGELPAAVVKQA